MEYVVLIVITVFAIMIVPPPEPITEEIEYDAWPHPETQTYNVGTSQ